MAETLAAGDLTTAFAKWLATKAPPKNETIRSSLNTNYGTTHVDIMKNLTRFLQNRS